MSSKKTPSERDSQDQLIAEARRHQAQQEKTYGGQVLKLYPRICARCGHCQLNERLVQLPSGMSYSWHEPTLHRLFQAPRLPC
jgi:hypothetical protein